MPDDDLEHLSFGVDRAIRTLREYVTGQNVIAVITDSTVDQWYRRWKRSGGDDTQLAIVDCFQSTRGGATTRTNVVSDELVVSGIERPVTEEALRSVLDQLFERWEHHPRDTVVYLESLDDLVGATDRETVERLLERISQRPSPAGSGLVAAVSDCSARDAVAFGDVFSETIGEPSFETDAPTAVRRLRTTDPTTFGYFRRYWRDAIDVLDRTDQSYVQAGQLDTELSARTLGATLSAFARLDALVVRADTNGPNRYDCRSYDPERAAELGLAVESLSE